MTNVDSLMKQERRSMVLDGVIAGLFLALGLICAWMGQEWWITSFCMVAVGQRLGKIPMRFRIIDWMHLAQQQDAMVESLVNHIEGPDQPEPTKSNNRVDYV